MKLFIAMLMVVAMAFPAAAAMYVPTIPIDGNGNPAPVIYDATSGSWLIDSGVVIDIDSINATVTTAPSTWSDSVTVRGTGSGNSLAVTVLGGCTSPAFTSTGIDTTSAFAAGTADTFDLGAVYDLIYVSSDTDILVALTAAEAIARVGDVQLAGMTGLYPYRTQYVYIRVKTGLALNGGLIVVRGMK